MVEIHLFFSIAVPCSCMDHVPFSVITPYSLCKDPQSVGRNLETIILGYVASGGERHTFWVLLFQKARILFQYHTKKWDSPPFQPGCHHLAFDLRTSRGRTQ